MDQSFSTSQPTLASYSNRGVGLALIGCATYMIAQLVMWFFPVIKALSIYIEASSVRSRVSSSGNVFQALNDSLGILGSAYDSMVAQPAHQLHDTIAPRTRCASTASDNTLDADALCHSSRWKCIGIAMYKSRHDVQPSLHAVKRTLHVGQH